MSGVNDSDAHAHELARLLAPIRAKVNLIPFNEHARITSYNVCYTKLLRESLTPGTSKFGGKITAADTTGPARGPLPASSTPAITLYPLNMACFSKAIMSAGKLPRISGKAFFFDSCSFAAQISQIVKLGSSYTSPGHHFNRITSYNVCYTKLLR